MDLEIAGRIQDSRHKRTCVFDYPIDPASAIGYTLVLLALRATPRGRIHKPPPTDIAPRAQTRFERGGASCGRSVLQIPPRDGRFKAVKRLNDLTPACRRVRTADGRFNSSPVTVEAGAVNRVDDSSIFTR